jgi:hypothetical protein
MNRSKEMSQTVRFHSLKPQMALYPPYEAHSQNKGYSEKGKEDQMHRHLTSSSDKYRRMTSHTWVA